MAEQMVFPETVEEFMEQYKVVDCQDVYSIGGEFVPIYRMAQWFVHEKEKAAQSCEQDRVQGYTENYVTELEAKNKELQALVKSWEETATYRHRKIEELNAQIKALTFAIRCLGVSGKEVLWR